MKHWLVQPEVRWWSCTRFSGHFVGLHAHGGGYNWGGMLPWAIRPGSDLRDHRYQGFSLSVRASATAITGCWATRWGLEATVGVGYAYLRLRQISVCEMRPENRQRLRTLFRPHQSGHHPDFYDKINFRPDRRKK